MEGIIQPIEAGGLVKSVADGQIKIHLYGRLGVFVVPRDVICGEEEIQPGHDLGFYFSYIEVVDKPFDYDIEELKSGDGEIPCLVGGVLTEVNDTAVSVEMNHQLGAVRTPRRWIFTNKELQVGQKVEFYFSRMKIKGKREIPIASI